MHSLSPEAFFDLSAFSHRDLFLDCHNVWQALERVTPYLKENLAPIMGMKDFLKRPLPQTLVFWRGRVWTEDFEFIGGDVPKGTFRLRVGGEVTTEAVVLYAGSILWDEEISFGAGSVIEPGALIKGPTIIGSHTEVRQGAYIRGKCIVGDRCVVGHTTEMKGSVMLNGAKAGHFAYVGDSILGMESNLGAGTKLANLKIKEGNIEIRYGGVRLETALRKLGAILGDHVEIGCNSVTNPGTLLGKGCKVFPVTSIPAGYYEANSIIRPPS